MGLTGSYFQFKQFTIYQDECAQKVSTDSCIQGAWTPLYPSIAHALDIGTGTGLLALMLAAREPSLQIIALEIDEKTAAQASSNVLKAPYAARVQVSHGDVKSFQFERQFDLIICNPPFFSKSLLSSDPKKNAAHHDVTLSYRDIIESWDSWLLPDGFASILLPSEQFELFTTQAAAGGYTPIERLLVQHTASKPVKRIVGIFKRGQPLPPQDQRLEIKLSNNEYSPEFIRLMQPFYLFL
jgi:tRNA1Val (adenine37-N6)-methyltransferase